MYNKKLEERNHKVALNDQGEIIDRMILDDKWLVLDRISLGLGVAGAVPYDKLGKLTSIVRQLEKKEKKSSTDNKKDVTAERSSAEQRDESRRIMQSLYVDAVSGLNAFSKYTHQMLDDRQESDEKLRNLFGELNEAGASIATTMRAIGTFSKNVTNNVFAIFFPLDLFSFLFLYISVP